MSKKMKTGKAYGYLDHVGSPIELIGDMELGKVRANFPENLEFTVLGVNERKRLPARIAETAEGADVYGAVSTDKMENLPKTPKKAADLRYIVMARAPEVTHSELPAPPGQGKANELTAGMLNEVLSFVGDRECHVGHSKFLRAAVFYQDGRGTAQRY